MNKTFDEAEETAWKLILAGYGLLEEVHRVRGDETGPSKYFEHLGVDPDFFVVAQRIQKEVLARRREGTGNIC